MSIHGGMGPLKRGKQNAGVRITPDEYAKLRSWRLYNEGEYAEKIEQMKEDQAEMRQKINAWMERVIEGDDEELVEDDEGIEEE